MVCVPDWDCACDEGGFGSAAAPPSPSGRLSFGFSELSSGSSGTGLLGVGEDMSSEVGSVVSVVVGGVDVVDVGVVALELVEVGGMYACGGRYGSSTISVLDDVVGRGTRLSFVSVSEESEFGSVVCCSSASLGTGGSGAEVSIFD